MPAISDATLRVLVGEHRRFRTRRRATCPSRVGAAGRRHRPASVAVVPDVEHVDRVDLSRAYSLRRVWASTSGNAARAHAPGVVVGAGERQAPTTTTTAATTTCRGSTRRGWATRAATTRSRTQAGLSATTIASAPAALGGVDRPDGVDRRVARSRCSCRSRAGCPPTVSTRWSNAPATEISRSLTSDPPTHATVNDVGVVLGRQEAGVVGARDRADVPDPRRRLVGLVLAIGVAGADAGRRRPRRSRDHTTDPHRHPAEAAPRAQHAEAAR